MVIALLPICLKQSMALSLPSLFLWLGSSGKNFIKLRFGKVVSCTSLTEVSKWLSLYDNCYTAASGQSPLGWQELLKANVLSQHGSDPKKLLEYLKS
jgi:hypothetical protein